MSTIAKNWGNWDSTKYFILLEPDSGWTYITPPRDPSLIHQLHFFKAVELDGALDAATNSWNPTDSVLETYDTSNPDAPAQESLTHQTTPHRKRALASDGEHLFVAGEGIPAVYMGDYGEPYGNEVKGWRKIRGGWCKNMRCIARDDTYGLDVVGDTLYAANWYALLKFPFSDLDEAIDGEPSYPTAERFFSAAC